MYDKGCGYNTSVKVVAIFSFFCLKYSKIYIKLVKVSEIPLPSKIFLEIRTFLILVFLENLRKLIKMEKNFVFGLAHKIVTIKA